MGIKILRIPATDGWDSDHARIVLDFPSVMDIVISNLDNIIRVRTRSGEQPSRSHDIFAQYLNNMRCLKNWSQSLESSSGELRDGSDVGFHQQAAEHQQQDLELPGFGAQSFSDNFLLAANQDNFLWETLNRQNDDWMAFGS
jgi:hypothetical protein